MNYKKHRILNGELILSELLSSILLFVFSTIALDKSSTKEESLIMWLLAAMSIASIILCFVFMRHYHEFDAEGMRIWYFGGKYQYVKWRNIRSIKIYSVNPGRRGGTLLLILMLFFVYRKYIVEGKIENNLKLDRDFIVSKSFRTTMYINRYWNGVIKGTFKERATKKKLSKDLDSTKVREMEKSVTQVADNIIDEYREKFAVLGVDLRRNYTYSYSDCSGKSKTRPYGDYTYDIEVTMHELHKDHNVNLSFAVELMDVQVGKNEHLGNEMESFENILKEELDYYIDEISKYGFKKCYETEKVNFTDGGFVKHKAAKLLVVVSIALIIAAIIIVLFV